MAEIIRMRPSDWEAYSKNIMLVEKRSFEPDVRMSKMQVSMTMLDENSMNYVAKIDETMVGYLMSSLIRSYNELDNFSHEFSFGKKDAAYIESIAVLPGFQNKNIGGLMIEQLIEDAAQTGLLKVTLHATSDSMICVAEKKGFEKVKYFDEWVGARDAWYMEKFLA